MNDPKEEMIMKKSEKTPKTVFEAMPKNDQKVFRALARMCSTDDKREVLSGVLCKANLQEGKTDTGEWIATDGRRLGRVNSRDEAYDRWICGIKRKGGRTFGSAMIGTIGDEMVERYPNFEQVTPEYQESRSMNLKVKQVMAQCVRQIEGYAIQQKIDEFQKDHREDLKLVLPADLQVDRMRVQGASGIKIKLSPGWFDPHFVWDAMNLMDAVGVVECAFDQEDEYNACLIRSYTGAVRAEVVIMQMRV